MRLRLLSVLVIAAALAAPVAQAQPSLEYAVKAAYLAKFAPFIDWPEGAFAAPNAPLTICILGPDPFGGELDKALAGQKDGDHPLALRRMPAPESASACHILFIDDAAQAEQALQDMKTRPVLTVTDSRLRAHGVISFVVIDNHVRFDIDKEAADNVGLSISSKLLSLAHAVHRGPR